MALPVCGPPVPPATSAGDIIRRFQFHTRAPDPGIWVLLRSWCGEAGFPCGWGLLLLWESGNSVQCWNGKIIGLILKPHLTWAGFFIYNYRNYSKHTTLRIFCVSFTGFLWTLSPLQYLSPARPNGIALHDIIKTSQIHSVNNPNIFNLTVAMEIIPASCDYDIPLVSITLLNKLAPGMYISNTIFGYGLIQK